MAHPPPNNSSLSLHDPLLQVVPRAIGRLKTLLLESTPENLQEIIAHLSHPAPLLEQLFIGGGSEPQDTTVLTTTLFNGNLSLLHHLHIQSIRTQLPWRNMVNLTSFALFYPSPEEPSITHLLDFFEGAPHLLDIRLHLTASSTGAQDDRLVPLPCLKRMAIIGETPSSPLLDHLLIPAGAKLITRGTFHDSTIEDHLPRSLDNLKNLSNFTTIRLSVGGPRPYVRLTGPNGQFYIVPVAPPVSTNHLTVDSLAQFDTSGIERFDLDHHNSMYSEALYQALLPMKNLRTLTLSRFTYQTSVTWALHPNMCPSNDVICPKLEELVLVFATGRVFYLEGLIETAATRASRGAKLSTVRIVVQGELDPRSVLELRKYVSHVEHGPDVGGTTDDSDDSDDSDSDGDSDDSDDSDEDSGDSDEEE